MKTSSLAVALASAALIALPAAASAEYQNGGPGGWQNNRWENREVTGRVTGAWPYNLDVSGAPHVRLHNGTVIEPTGTTLQPGMRVRISGHPNRDGTFEADRITVENSRRRTEYRY
jgi:hypothetical protein